MDALYALKQFAPFCLWQNSSLNFLFLEKVFLNEFTQNHFSTRYLIFSLIG